MAKVALVTIDDCDARYQCENCETESEMSIHSGVARLSAITRQRRAGGDGGGSSVVFALATRLVTCYAVCRS